MSAQLSLLPEGRHESRSALHGTQMASRSMLQLTEVSGKVVRHSAMLEVAPDALHRVPLRGAGRQVFQRAGATLGLDVLADEFGAMCLQAVPDDRQLAPDRGLQRLEQLVTCGVRIAPGNRRK